MDKSYNYEAVELYYRKQVIFSESRAMCPVLGSFNFLCLNVISGVAHKYSLLYK